MPARTLSVAKRVLRQLLRDRRFLVLSVVAPLLIVYFLKLFFDTLSGPGFTVSRYIVPVAAFIVHFLTYLLCAIVLVRERVAETLSRMFINGFRRVEIISGYIMAYTLLATLQSLLVLVEINWFFNLNYQLDKQLSIFAVIWLLAVISIALGIFFSNFARNEGQVFPFIPLVIFPSVFLSGLLITVERLPEGWQWFSRLVPLYYANQVLQRLITPTGILADEWANLVALLVYGTVVLILANFTLKEQE